MYFFMSWRRVAELDIDMDAEQETFLEAWMCGGTLSQCGQQLGCGFGGEAKQVVGLRRGTRIFDNFLSGVGQNTT